jgi:hypothetical protein
VVLSVSSHVKGVYNPRAVILHAALLRQACAHCGKFLAAASRRSLGRVSVPVWLVVLSDQPPITVLVGHYPTNKLMGRRPHPQRPKALPDTRPGPCGISIPFGTLSPTAGQVTHALLSRPPLLHPKVQASDLHALGTPPAFVLSQDQTRQQTAEAVMVNGLRCCSGKKN